MSDGRRISFLVSSVSVSVSFSFLILFLIYPPSLSHLIPSHHIYTAPLPLFSLLFSLPFCFPFFWGCKKKPRTPCPSSLAVVCSCSTFLDYPGPPFLMKLDLIVHSFTHSLYNGRRLVCIFIFIFHFLFPITLYVKIPLRAQKKLNQKLKSPESRGKWRNYLHSYFSFPFLFLLWVFGLGKNFPFHD